MDPADGEYELFVFPVRIENVVVVRAAHQKKMGVLLGGVMRQDAAEQPLRQIRMWIGIGETERWVKLGQPSGEFVVLEADEDNEGEVKGLQVVDVQSCVEGFALVEQLHGRPVAC